MRLKKREKTLNAVLNRINQATVVKNMVVWLNQEECREIMAYWSHFKVSEARIITLHRNHWIGMFWCFFMGFCIAMYIWK